MVHLQTHGENHTKEESLHALSCYYDTVDSTLRQPVQLTDQTDLPEGTPLEIEARPITRNQRDKRSSNKKDDMTSSTQTGVAFPKEHNKEDLSLDVITMTSAPSVLQLNVIDRDGSMTTFVYPGKQVALELHTAHHSKYIYSTVTYNVAILSIVSYKYRDTGIILFASDIKMCTAICLGEVPFMQCINK